MKIKIDKKRILLNPVHPVETNVRIFCVFVFVFLLIPTSNIFSQESSIVLIENEFAKIDSAVAGLQSQRVELSNEGQTYAREIEQLKANTPLNYFQHQRLEKLLKNSQDLANEIERIDLELRVLNKNYRETGQQLIRLYDSEINKSLRSLENEGLSPESRQSLILEIEKQRAKKEAVKSRISLDALKNFTLSEVEIKPDDTPKQITQKADLLKDQEDKLRNLASQLSKQTKELQKELEIRTRISELVTDLALFDQQEEAIGDVSSLSQKRNIGVEDVSGEDFTINSEFIQENLLVGQRNFDFSNLTTEQLEDVVENFKKQRKQVQAQADSLALQAEAFYKAAQDMKKQ